MENSRTVAVVLVHGGLAIDANGNLLATGGFGQEVKFDTVTLTNNASQSLFVALFENGTTVWAKQAGGGGAGGDGGTGLGVDRTGNIYVGGIIGRAQPGRTLQFDSIILTNIGLTDIFVLRIGGSAPENGPPLNFSISLGNIVLTWPLANADFRVQSTVALSTPFGPASEPRTNNTGAGTISVTINPSGPQKFYRLTRP